MSEQRRRAAAVVVAAGRGVRFGEPDKVFYALAGRPVLASSLDAVERANSIETVVLVVGHHTRATAEDLVAGGRWSKVTAIVSGGKRRQDSVAAGLGAVPGGIDVVAIHDGARPFAPASLFDACVTAAAATGAAIAAVPVTDTIKRVAEGHIVNTVSRDDLWAAQTPQAFDVARLRQALATAERQGWTVTDEASLFEALGWPVRIVPGAPSNLKITHRVDLTIAEAILRQDKSQELGAGGWRLEARMTYRTGIGYDAHRFDADRTLTLGGVQIPYQRGLAGHSDADVLLHAIADAILGAAALGDIGQHFPPTDPAFKDADSRDLLARVHALVAAQGYEVVNVDATMIAEAPRIGPHVAAMRETIATTLDVAEDAISLKATTNEGMGFVGREEGIAALAVATLRRST